MTNKLVKKTELELVKELKEFFVTNANIADSILIAGKPSTTNINFYTRQKEWCDPLATRLIKLVEDLGRESMEDRVIRALHQTKDVDDINSVIESIGCYRDIIIQNKFTSFEEKIVHLQKEISGMRDIITNLTTEKEEVATDTKPKQEVDKEKKIVKLKSKNQRLKYGYKMV